MKGEKLIDLKNQRDNLEETTNVLIAELEYFENRVNSNKLTKDDKDCVIEDIKDCRKVLAILMNKVKNIVIIRKNGGK